MASTWSRAETADIAQGGYVLDPGRTFDISGWRKSDTHVAAFEFAALTDSYAARTGRPGNVGVIGMAAFLEKPAPPPEAPEVTRTPFTEDGRHGGAARQNESRADAADAAEAATAEAPPAPAVRAARAAQSAPSSENAASVAGNASTDSAASAASAGAMAQEKSAAGPASIASAPTRRERLGTAHGQREWSVTRPTTFERLSSTPQDLIEIAYDSYANLVAAGVIPQPTPRPRAFPNHNDSRGFVPDPPAY